MNRRSHSSDKPALLLSPAKPLPDLRPSSARGVEVNASVQLQLQFLIDSLGENAKEFTVDSCKKLHITPHQSLLPDDPEGDKFCVVTIVPHEGSLMTFEMHVQSGTIRTARRIQVDPKTRKRGFVSCINHDYAISILYTAVKEAYRTMSRPGVLGEILEEGKEEHKD